MGCECGSVFGVRSPRYVSVSVLSSPRAASLDVSPFARGFECLEGIRFAVYLTFIERTDWFQVFMVQSSRYPRSISSHVCTQGEKEMPVVLCRSSPGLLNLLMEVLLSDAEPNPMALGLDVSVRRSLAI